MIGLLISSVYTHPPLPSTILLVDDEDHHPPSRRPFWLLLSAIPPRIAPNFYLDGLGAVSVTSPHGSYSTCQEILVRILQTTTYHLNYTCGTGK